MRCAQSRVGGREVDPDSLSSRRASGRGEREEEGKTAN